MENANSTSDGMRDCNGLNPSSNLDDQMRMFQDDNGEYVGHGDHGGKAGGRDGRRHVDQRHDVARARADGKQRRQRKQPNNAEESYALRSGTGHLRTMSRKKIILNNFEGARVWIILKLDFYII